MDGISQEGLLLNIEPRGLGEVSFWSVSFLEVCKDGKNSRQDADNS